MSAVLSLAISIFYTHTIPGVRACPRLPLRKIEFGGICRAPVAWRVHAHRRQVFHICNNHLRLDDCAANERKDEQLLGKDGGPGGSEEDRRRHLEYLSREHQCVGLGHKTASIVHAEIVPTTSS